MDISETLGHRDMEKAAMWITEDHQYAMDDVSRMPLDPEMVQEARMIEMEYIEKWEFGKK